MLLFQKVYLGFQMNYRLVSASTYLLVALISLPGLYVRPALGNHQAESTIAQASSNEEQRQCENAISNAVNTIEDGRAVQVVEVAPVNLSERFDDYPANAPAGVVLRLEGPATANVLSSDQFMTSVSTGIIEACGPVSLVDFQMNATDWTVVFGLVDGNIVPFECLTPGPGPDAQWGQRFCF